jgi:hypothetical protein
MNPAPAPVAGNGSVWANASTKGGWLLGVGNDDRGPVKAKVVVLGLKGGSAKQ